MRKSKLSAQEVAELDAFNKGETRNSGFGLMSVRDKGYTTLNNGSLLQWHTNRPLREGEARQSVGDGYILIDGKIFSAEELMRFTRWA